MQNLRFSIPNLAFLLSLVLISFTPKKKPLRFNLEVGKDYKLHTTAEQQITQTLNGVEQSMQQLIKYKLNYNVKDKQNGLTTLAVHYESFVYKMDMAPYFSIDYDSEKDQQQDNPLYGYLDAMMDQQFIITLDDQGQVKSIEGLNKNIDKVVRQEGSGNSMQRQQYAKQLQELMGEENFKNSFEAITAIYPDKEVAVGDSWTKDLKHHSEMPVRYVNTYTLTDSKNGQSTIKLNSEIASVKTQQQSAQQDFDISGKQEGTIRVDEKSGWILHSDITNEVKGKVFMKNEQVPQGMEVPLTISSRIITKGE
jgi:hypothetical protein